MYVFVTICRNIGFQLWNPAHPFHQAPTETFFSASSQSLTNHLAKTRKWTLRAAVRIPPEEEEDEIEERTPSLADAKDVSMQWRQLYQDWKRVSNSTEGFSRWNTRFRFTPDRLWQEFCVIIPVHHKYTVVMHFEFHELVLAGYIGNKKNVDRGFIRSPLVRTFVASVPLCGDALDRRQVRVSLGCLSSFFYQTS